LLHTGTRATCIQHWVGCGEFGCVERCLKTSAIEGRHVKMDGMKQAR
jgi:hypothetical protein